MTYVYICPGIIYLYIIYYSFDETAAGLHVEILMHAYVHVNLPRS